MSPLHRIPPAPVRRIGVAVVALVLGAGCATVSPWERGRLSHPAMQIEPRVGDAFQNHLRPIREGAIGGEGGAGGGCGCN